MLIECNTNTLNRERILLSPKEVTMNESIDSFLKEAEKCLFVPEVVVLK